MNIVMKPGAITISSVDFFSMQEGLDYLNEQCDDEEFQGCVLEYLPKDYAYLSNLGEVLFAMGSEHVEECEWEFTYKTSCEKTTLVISNLK